MTSFSSVHRQRLKLVEELVEFSGGLDDKLVERIITYAECMYSPDSEEISEATFMSEMFTQFNMTSNVMIPLIFDVYDSDRNGVITRTDMYVMLKPTLTHNDEDNEELLKELVDLVIKTVDFDGNGTIDLEEFRRLSIKDKLCLELLGQCLPEVKVVLQFKNKLMSRTSHELKPLFESERSHETYRSLSTTKSYYPISLDFDVQN